jgi:hypothetical protein
MATTLTTAAADAMSSALNTYIGNTAKLKIYDATGGVPANAGTALGSQVVLATFTLNSPGFTSSGGVLTLSTSPALTVAASASGTAAFFRLFKTDGTTVVMQGTVGTSGQQLNLNTTTITATVNVSITSGTITVPTS